MCGKGHHLKTGFKREKKIIESFTGTGSVGIVNGLPLHCIFKTCPVSHYRQLQKRERTGKE